MQMKKLFDMRNNGATLQEIADEVNLSKQRVHQIMLKNNPEMKGMRGKGFNIETIVYKGIYEHFKNNEYESLSSFSLKVFGYTGKNNIPSIRRFVIGEYKNSRFTIQQMQKICEIVGMPFEKVFERRCEQ